MMSLVVRFAVKVFRRMKMWFEWDSWKNYNFFKGVRWRTHSASREFVALLLGSRAQITWRDATKIGLTSFRNLSDIAFLFMELHRPQEIRSLFMTRRKVTFERWECAHSGTTVVDIKGILFPLRFFYQTITWLLNFRPLGILFFTETEIPP